MQYSLQCQGLLDQIPVEVQQLPDDGKNIIVSSVADMKRLFRVLHSRGKCLLVLKEWDGDALLREYEMKNPGLVALIHSGNETGFEAECGNTILRHHEGYGRKLLEDKDVIPGLRTPGPDVCPCRDHGHCV